MAQVYDVVIVGGGGVGSAIAYFLTAHPEFRGTVAVVERDPTYANCSTTRSAGSVRQQFSTPANIELSKFGAHFLKHIGDYLAVDGEVPQISFRENGYLFLASESGRAVLEQNHAVQKAHGADNVLLPPSSLAERFPWLNTEGLALGSLGLSNEGWFDPYALLQGYKRKARAQGAIYLSDEVVAVARRGGRILGVTLKSAGGVACGHMVDAAGPFGGAVAALAGVALPVRPRKRFVYVFDCRAPVEGCPLLIDPTGVWVRPEGRQFICGVSPDESDDPDCEDLELDYRQWEEIVWPTLAARIPAFEAVKLTNAWAGHYDYNTVDQNAILGPHPEIGNLLFANGFSGHGIQQSPAVGRAITELILYGGYRSIELSVFAYSEERLSGRRPVRELNVV
ncbi:MAG TPA: FAD-binding oxidoreductase [Alphaproteobacteria bacterium]|nr:FAD-binding oxidoreductase [Alphaproteobacteria bacterium]